MDGLHPRGEAANRPAFQFSGHTGLDVEMITLGSAAPEGQVALAGPSDRTDRPHLPVRGDLAHIGLAGRYFVPHYAVPMPHRVTAATALLAAGRADGEALRPVAAGEVFDVLDMAGGWAWGQAEGDKLVGYLPLAVLDALA